MKCHRCDLLSRVSSRKINWYTVLQPENDLFEHEIQPNCPKIANIQLIV